MIYPTIQYIVPIVMPIGLNLAVGGIGSYLAKQLLETLTEKILTRSESSSPSEVRTARKIVILTITAVTASVGATYVFVGSLAAVCIAIAALFGTLVGSRNHVQYIKLNPGEVPPSNDLVLYEEDPNDPSVQLFLKLREWCEALKSAKVEYSLLAGRKFVLKLQDQTIKLNFDHLISMTDNLFYQQFRSLLPELNSDEPSILARYRTIYKSIDLTQQFKSIISVWGASAESKQHVPFLYLIFRIHRFFDLQFDAQKVTYISERADMQMASFENNLKFIAYSSFLNLNTYIPAVVNQKKFLEDLSTIDHTKTHDETRKTKTKIMRIKNDSINVLKQMKEGLLSENLTEKVQKELDECDEKLRKCEQEKLEMIQDLQKFEEKIKADKKRSQDDILRIKKQIESFEIKIAAFRRQLEWSMELLSSLPDSRQLEILFTYNIDEIQGKPSNPVLDKFLADLEEAKKERNPKRIFSLEAGYTLEDVKKAMKNLRMLHPDKNIGCEERAAWLFKVIYPIGKLLEKRMDKNRTPEPVNFFNSL